MTSPTTDINLAACETAKAMIRAEIVAAAQRCRAATNTDDAARRHETPSMLCGIQGCAYLPHMTGPHTWEQR